VEIIPDKEKLVGFVEQAYEGKLCLPNFQRDFVWPRDQVADLVRSILRRYFIGSLLLLRCDPNQPPFAPVYLRGAKASQPEPRPERLVLDGQQRLTSLLYALTAPKLPLKGSSQQRWFFVDLNLLLQDPENDEVVFDRTQRELDGLDSDSTQYMRRILPCVKLLRSGDFLRWRDGLDDWLRDREPENHQRFRGEWRDPWTEAVTGFQTFQIPFVELPIISDSDPAAIARVCAIFEKLNSSGIDLSVYDLLTARLYRSGIRLHNLWDESCKDHARLAKWSKRKADTNKFGVLVLRTLALRRGLDPKPSTLINLRPESFERDWRRAAAAIERSLELIELVAEDGFGVFNQKWLPGFGLMPILAALRSEIDDHDLGEEQRLDLRRWYWCNVFLERYSSGVESKSRKDYVEMLKYWNEGKPEPTVFVEARARIAAEGYSVRESASYASAVYSGIFCLMAIRGARDWARGENIQLQALEDHHIFPQAYLKRRGITNRSEINSVVNRTLISDATNRRISDKSPSAYLGNRNVFPSGPIEDLLRPHFLDTASLAVLRTSDDSISPDDAKKHYEAFRIAREAEIIKEIRTVCGVQR
jgi:hypothetical protein